MTRWRPIALSGKHRKAANRPGGTLLILPWPPGLPLGKPLALDDERDATAAEHAAAVEIVGPACAAADAATAARPSITTRVRAITTSRATELNTATD